MNANKDSESWYDEELDNKRASIGDSYFFLELTSLVVCCGCAGGT